MGSYQLGSTQRDRVGNLPRSAAAAGGRIAAEAAIRPLGPQTAGVGQTRPCGYGQAGFLHHCDDDRGDRGDRRKGGPGQACRIRFVPMQSRSTSTALTLAHGRLEVDRANERDVANAIARSAPAREQKHSCRARSADGPDWANPVVRLWRRWRAWRSRSRRPREAGLPEKGRSPDGLTGPVRACYEVGPIGFGLYRGGGDRLSAGSAIICATRSTFAIRRVRSRGSSSAAWKHEQ
jgi:hypothetical protein